MIEKTVQSLSERGYVCLPVGEDKRPLVSQWSKNTVATQEDWLSLFKEHIAIIAGPHSGIICIDIDLKNAPDAEARKKILDKVNATIPESLKSKLSLARTPSGGFHLYVRTKMKIKTGHLLKLEGKPVVEIRGFGSYFLVPPSPGYEYKTTPTITRQLVELEALTDKETQLLLERLYQMGKKTRTSIAKQDDKKFSKEYNKQVIEGIIAQVQEHRIDITHGYDDWLRIGFVIARNFGEEGRSYFHDISSIYHEYDSNECDLQYQKCLDSERQSGAGGVNFGFLIHICQQYGLNTGVSDVSPFLPEPKNWRSYKPEEKANILDFIRKDSGIVFNELSHYLEKGGEVFGDREINALRESWCKKGYDILKGDFYDAFNNAMLPSVNPVREYIEALPAKTDTMHVEAMVDSLRVSTGMSAEDDLVLKEIIRKWLVSLIAAAYGDHPIDIILVFIGGQGSGKTWFFKKLLPKPVRTYFTSSMSMNDDKDMKEILCRYWIWCDDEMGGMRKKDIETIKSFASTEYFDWRPPYGRSIIKRERLAVICGTSNNVRIVNDDTGNRRFIPVIVDDRERESYDQIPRQELFAELKGMYYREGKPELTSTERAWLAKYTIQFRVTSAEGDAIESYIQTDEESEWLYAVEIASKLGDFLPNVRINTITLGRLLSNMGGLEKRRMGGGTQYRVTVQKVSSRSESGSGSDFDHDRPTGDMPGEPEELPF